MIEFEKVLKQHNPDWVVVVGDVNATLACSVTAKKEWIKCCHIEAGLRSGDLTMPEEVNRIVTDRVSDLLLTPDRISSQNLRNEGMPEKSIALVGNIMIDTLDANLQKAKEISLRQSLEKNWLAGEVKDLSALPYGLITLHRPANVDHYEVLNPLVDFLISEVGEQMHLVWPIHPRTFKQIKLFGLWEKIRDSKNVTLLHPLGYLEMLRFNMDARMILTDSGGLQEESMVLGTPCITMRWTTERPVTLRKLGGTSTLVGNDLNLIREEFYRALSSVRNPSRPEFWDGHTAERVLETILKYN
jgi:UDP-N-acetylglucosamine 2-epimerase (non-hydrolysing)